MNQKKYLEMYYEIQPIILLKEKLEYKPIVYRGDLYDFTKNYPHRSMLFNEIVIEYDDKDITKNREYADIVTTRLRKEGIGYAKWFSGGKSTHIHVLIPRETMLSLRNSSLFRKCFVRYFCDGLPIPDLQLTQDNHLIRCEYGFHEKTGKQKVLISNYKYGEYFVVPSDVWKRYVAEEKRVVSTRMTKDLSSLASHPGTQLIMTTEEFKKVKDGHTRGLFILIPILRKKYNKEELVQYMQDWYSYTGGTKLGKENIKKTVEYYYDKTYSVEFYENYLNNFLEEIGHPELVLTPKDLNNSTPKQERESI